SSDLADDPAARRAVTAEIAGVVVVDRDLVTVLGHRDRMLDRADAGVPGVDAAVQDAHAHTRTRRTAPRPVAGHAIGPRGRQPDGVAGRGREAPGRERLVRLVR